MAVLEDIEYNYCFWIPIHVFWKQAYEKSRKWKTRNGNWKWKWKQKKTSISIVQCFLHGLMSNVLCHYSCIPIALVLWLALWVMCFAFTLVLCFMITYSVWLTSALVASNVAIYSGSHVRGSGYKTSCYISDYESNSLSLGTGLAFLLSQPHS